MNIQEMHYDFKLKINKVDSQQYKNLLVPEIDWILNEAQELFVKMVAKPRLRNQLGFESSQRNTDDIRTLVKTGVLTITSNTSSLPTDYWHYLRAYVTMEKSPCGTSQARLHVRQHDDEFEESVFDKSSFEWRIVNGVFNVDGVEFYTDGTFTNVSCKMTYLVRPNYIHNAADFRGGTYSLPGSPAFTGTVDCELPFQTHREIVDIAVLIATGQLQIPDYQVKLAKLNLNNLK